MVVVRLSAEHLGSEGHVQQFEPAPHGGQQDGHVAVAGAEGLRFQPAGRSHFILQSVAQQIEVETLYDLQDRKFPIEVNSQRPTPAS